MASSGSIGNIVPKPKVRIGNDDYTRNRVNCETKGMTEW